MKLAIIGTGQVATKLLSYPLQANVEIKGIYDNNPDKWGQLFHGHEIMAVDSIKPSEYDLVILAIINGWMDVEEQLLSLGVSKIKILLAVGWSRLDYFTDELDEYFLANKKEFLSFEKKPVISLGHCGGEASKAHYRRSREGFFQKYCQGEGLDIGCGNDPIATGGGVCGWDFPNGDAQFLLTVPDESFDFVHSSHCIEHVEDVRISLQNWFRVLKIGGYLLLYLPHRDLYEKRRSLPSRFNPDHKHMFLIGRREEPDTLDIVEEIREALQGQNYRIIYVKTCDEGHTITDPLIHSDGEYSIEIVVQKIGVEYETRGMDKGGQCQ